MSQNGVLTPVLLHTLKLTARVLPGKQIEFTAPELTEGDDVEIFVALPKASDRTDTSALIRNALNQLTSSK